MKKNLRPRGKAGKIFLNTTSAKPVMYFINIETPGQARNKLPTIWSFFSIEGHCHLCTVISTSSYHWENAL